MSPFNRFKSYIQKPANVILIVLAVVLTYFTVVPLITMLINTVTVHTSEAMQIPGASVGSFTLYHWKKVLFTLSTATNIFYKPLLNTVVTALGTCLVSILAGGAFAWLVTRTNLRYKSVVSAMFILPYIMPSWTIALAWLDFFKNDLAGGPKGMFMAMTGMCPPNWFSYGAFPIIICQGLHYAPFAYILVGGILRNMDANLEEAALLLHANRWKTLRTVTLPIVTPAILSTFLLVFSSGLSSFAVPAFLGTPVRYQVLTTQMYRTLLGLNPGYGYLIAFVMILIGVGILAFNQKITGSRRSYTTVTGKSSNVSLVNLRGARTPLSLFVIITLVLVCIVPLVLFAIESFIMVQGNYSFSNMTSVFWIGPGDVTIANAEPGILRNTNIWGGLWNSVRLSVVVALVAGTVGILAGYAIARNRGRGLSKYVDNLTFFPYLMPSMAFGAIFLSMFAVRRGFVPALYGTFLLLVIVGSVKYLPFASRSGVNAMLQLSGEIEEAATIMGIPWWKRMLQIIFPIQKSSLLSGYLLPFISCMRELSLFILLVTPATRMLTTLLFQYNEKGWDQYANAINLMIVLIVVAFNLIVNKLTGASIDKGIGG